MGIFKSLFGKKNHQQAPINEQKGMHNPKGLKVVSSLQVKTDSPETPTPSSSPSKKMQNLIMLFLAERYRVNESKYPEYFRFRFGIGFPNESFRELEQKGLIRPASAVDSLSHLKLTELKEIAAEFGVKTSGKKVDVCERIIEQIPEESLEKYVPNRYWTITEAGQAMLDKNPYVSYYLGKHKYNLDAIGLDAKGIEKLFKNASTLRTRDVIWGELNRKTSECFEKDIPNGDFNTYCEILHIQALFLEEEKRYKDALETYVRYLHYRANFQAALDALKQYSYLSDTDEAADILYMKAKIYPFIADEIISINEGCRFKSEELKSFILEVIQGINDIGAFTPEELTRLIMLGLNGDEEGQKHLCKIAMKAAIKKMKQR